MKHRKKPKCIVCGKEASIHKLPHGEISLCYEFNCFQRFCQITQNSVPVVWVGSQDFIEHELLTEEDIKGHEYAIVQAADAVSSTLWENNFGDLYAEAMEYGAKEFELTKILNMKQEKLPLLIEHLHYPENKEHLLKRIKGYG